MIMKCVILAGGFAKRMWPMAMDFPKALLPIAEKPMVEHIIEKLYSIDGLDEIYISTNKKFEEPFRKWLNGFEPGSRVKISLLIEPALKEEEKFGSVRAIEYFIKTFGVKDNVLVIGGDNLFSFDMNEFLNFSRKRNAPAVAFYDIGDVEKVRNRLGVVTLDNDLKIKEFQEKPPEPKSTLVSTCIYYFLKDNLGMISTYLQDKNNPDAPGHFIAWLSQRTPVYGFVFKEQWYDIGSKEVYEQADEDLKNK